MAAARRSCGRRFNGLAGVLCGKSLTNPLTRTEARHNQRQNKTPHLFSSYAALDLNAF
jgi:hypothetical protein